MAIYWTAITFVAIYVMLADDSCLFQETGKLIIRVFQYFDLENRILKYIELVNTHTDTSDISLIFHIDYSESYLILRNLCKRGKIIKTYLGYKFKNE